MNKVIKGLLFFVSVVMIFTAQANRPDDKDHQKGSISRPVVAARNNPVIPAVQTRRETPRPAAARQSKADEHFKPVPNVHLQPLVQARVQPDQWRKQQPHVYAINAQAPVDNNRLFHREHHNNWQPRYNFYDNQYHFYPYVNIASVVDLSGGYMVVGPDGQSYLYDQGTFYLQQGGQFIAVPPPVGTIVNPLVTQARQIIVNGQVYFRYKGVFYVQGAQGFEVIGPVEGQTE